MKAKIRTNKKPCFICVTFFQVIISVLSLLFEILYSKFSRSDIVAPLSRKFTFSYQSTFAEPQDVINKICEFQNSLIEECELDISLSDISNFPRDDMFEISISLEYAVNGLEICDKIVERFDAFIVYLDNLSLE